MTEKGKDPQVANHVFDADSPNNVLEGTIAPDGSLVLKVYFKKVADPVTKGDINNNHRVNIVDAQLAYDVATGKYADDNMLDLLANLTVPAFRTPRSIGPPTSMATGT